MEGAVLNLVFEAPLVDLCLADSALKVALVAHEDDHGLVGLHLAQVIPLFLDVFEGNFAGEVEDHEHAVTSLEVGGDDRSILLLSGGVPDVQFGWFVFEDDVLYLEVDCGDLCFLLCKEVTFCEPPKECCLAHVAISHYDDLVPLLVLVVTQISVLYHIYK